MNVETVVLALSLGATAGILAGLFGVGGGILFVPLLVMLGLGQVEAAATSLLAVVPTAAVGSWRQHRYGNLRGRAALVLGAAAVVGVEAGVQIATSIPGGVLRRLLGILLVVVAVQLIVRTIRSARAVP